MNKKSARLLIEYLVTSKEQLLNFYIFEDEFKTYFKLDLNDSKNVAEFTKTFHDKLLKFGIQSANSCELVLNTFDFSFTQTSISDKFSNAKYKKNYLIDTYGEDYKDKFIFNNVDFISSQKIEISTFYTVPVSRIQEISGILKELGITNCRVSLMSEYISGYVSSNNLNDCVLVLDEDDFSIVSFISGKKLVGSTFVDKENAEISDLKNLIMSYGCKVIEPNNIFIDKLYLSNNIKDTYFEDQSAQILPKFKFADIFKNEISKSVSNLSEFKKSETSTVKKNSFFSFSLGKKKGFTLIESAVSLLIFGIISALVLTFITSFRNHNIDSKRRILAETFLKSVSACFQEDPEDTITKLTKDEVVPTDSKSYELFLDNNMDIENSSEIDMGMVFVLSYSCGSSTFDTVIQNETKIFTEYKLTISYIATLSRNKIYCDRTEFMVVK